MAANPLKTSETVVSEEIFASLIRLNQEHSSLVAQRVALATLAGACRALCEMKQDEMGEGGFDAAFRRLVLFNLSQASDDCERIFALRH